MRIPKILVFIILLAGFSYLIPVLTKAQPGPENGGNFGLGLMLGEPTGASIKSGTINLLPSYFLKPYPASGLLDKRR